MEVEDDLMGRGPDFLSHGEVLVTECSDPMQDVVAPSSARNRVTH